MRTALPDPLVPALRRVIVSAALLGLGPAVVAAQDEAREGLPNLLCVAGNCQLGVGIAESPDGTRRYEGEWEAGAPSGHGRLVVFGDWDRSRVVYATFEQGRNRDACVLPLGPWSLEREKGCPEPPWSAPARAVHHLIEAEALLPDSARAALALVRAHAELQLGEYLAHSGVGGGDRRALDLALVHLRLARLMAERIDQAGSAVAVRAREVEEGLREHLGR